MFSSLQNVLKSMGNRQTTNKAVYFISSAKLDKIFIKNVVQSRIQFFANVFDQKRSSKGKGVFQVIPEILVIEISDL